MELNTADIFGHLTTDKGQLLFSPNVGTADFPGLCLLMIPVTTREPNPYSSPRNISPVNECSK